ncbi:MAG: glycoside hydrolase/deacetylase [Paenibacillus sp.]|nr:glycoside hydrolase/deacetylase [Paenibacillus sp.]
MKKARVAILTDLHIVAQYHHYGLNVFGMYATEVLAHAGMSADVLHDASTLNDGEYDIVIVAVCSEDELTAQRLISYMESGGVVINCGGVNKLASRLGYARSKVEIGYMRVNSDVGKKLPPLRFLQAFPWTAEKGDLTTLPFMEKGILTRLSPEGEVAGCGLQAFRIGEGALYRWSVDLWDAIVRLQQGAGPVFEDGFPAPDGSCAVNDGVIKADDQASMDWKWDMRQTEKGKSYFAFPYADLWREMFLSTLLEIVVASELNYPFIGLYPSGVEHVALISHDSDRNENAHAEAMLDILEECGVRSTWCMLEPGYENSIYKRLKEAGHEIAFHYNAREEEGEHWSKAAFEKQLQWLKEAAGVEEITSNKNHYTRFEGWGELFEWCEAFGVASDQTRGPSKRGNIGFIFGTCHPYFPIAWSNDGNRLYDVLEIGFLTQDLGQADSEVIRPFLERVASVEGIAHFLYHQYHIYTREEVRDSFRLLVAEARAMGFEFWTSKQINEWERVRRKWKVQITEDGVFIEEGPHPEQDIVVYIPVLNGKNHGLAGASEADKIVKYGVVCYKITIPTQ